MSCTFYPPPLSDGLKKLQEFRSSSFLIDIVLSFEDHHFLAHRFVLSSFSNFLDSSTVVNNHLSLNFGESSPDADTLSLVLLSLYNVPFSVNSNNIVDVYSLLLRPSLGLLLLLIFAIGSKIQDFIWFLSLILTWKPIFRLIKTKKLVRISSMILW
ncbi:hypothetical protein P9112_005897 [Eukaryota sp. TZLM1-RC]